MRIIGAEPAGDTVREVTGPVVDEHPELPHWNDAPTGQVPAILDRSNGEEQAVAPPTWREEETDWEAQEEVFEPSMLSDDLPAVGALLGEQSEEIDVERQPWHFESDDTLVIPPEPGFEPLPEPEPEPGRDPTPIPFAAGPRALRAGVRTGRGRPRVASPVTAAASAAAGLAADAARSHPSPRRARAADDAAAGANVAHRQRQHGGDRRAATCAWPSARASCSARSALACFAAGTVASMVIVSVVVLLATAEAYAAFRRAQYHPATLLGLVAVLSLLVETYNKGVAALPLVLVLLVAGSFIWYLARVEPAAEPVSGIASTVFVFVWVGAFGSFAALLLDPNLFPDRHGIAFVLAAVIVTVADDVALPPGRLGHGAPPAGALHQPQQELGGADRRRRGGHPRLRRRRPLHPPLDGRARPRSTAWSWRSWPRWAT